MEVKQNNAQVIGIDPGLQRFQFAITCVHQGDHHCVAVTTTADQMKSLQSSAPGIYDRLEKEIGLNPHRTSYFELHPDGKVFKVNYKNITAQPEHSQGPVMVPRRGQWTDMEEVKAELGDVLPPKYEDLTPDLTQHSMPSLTPPDRRVEQKKKIKL